jgi:hypothetical protein
MDNGIMPVPKFYLRIWLDTSSSLSTEAGRSNYPDFHFETYFSPNFIPTGRKAYNQIKIWASDYKYLFVAPISQK